MSLTRLTESLEVCREDIVAMPLQEGATSLTEEVQGKKFECHAVYRVPVSKINDLQHLNLNGRAYTEELWNNVVNNQKHIWEGCVGLADHPENDSDGSVRDIFAVWHNLSVNKAKGIVESDLHLVGPYGKLAEEVIQAGGKLGFSSSGFGELKEDGKTVDPKTYMLERVSDWVLTPSQEVFGTRDMKIKTESVTNSITEKKENSMADTSATSKVKVTKLEEKLFRKNIEASLTEAEQIKDPQARLNELHEIRSYFEEYEAPDLLEKVDEAIKLAEGSITDIVKNHLKMEETFGLAKEEELKKSLSRIAESKKITESQARDWKKVSETLQSKIQELQKTLSEYPTPESYEESLAFNRKLRISFIEQKKTLKEGIAQLEKQLEGQNEVNAAMKALAEKAISEKKLVEAKLAETQKALQESKAQTALVNKKLEENRAAMEKLIVKYESAPTPQLRKAPSMPVQFTEKAEVEKYWKDLSIRHGEDITPYKNRILGCKTLQEAMMVYTKILPSIKEVKVLPGNVPEKARLDYIQEATGRRVAAAKKTPRLPEGWI